MMRTPAGILFLGFSLKKSNHVCEGGEGEGGGVKGRGEGVRGEWESEWVGVISDGVRGSGGPCYTCTLHNLSRDSATVRRNTRVDKYAL